MEDSLVSIVALNWNGLGHLETCLTSLCGQTHAPREVILMDNGSNDGSVEYTRTNFPEVRVVHLPENHGIGPGVNAGVAAARGEFIALINNDTEADSGWVTEAVRALRDHPEAGFTASRMRLFARRTHLDGAGDLFFSTGYPGKRGWLMRDGPEFDGNAWVFGACAGAAVYRRSMIDEIGMFDESYYACFEDLDLSFRAQLMGYSCLYVGSSIIYHKLGSTVGFSLSNPEQAFRAHRNRWYTVIKNVPLALLRRYLAQMVAAEAVVLASSARRGRLKVLLRARAAVVREMPRLRAKRRAIQSRRKRSIEGLDAVIRKDWFAHRMAERRREIEDAAATRPNPRP